MDAGTDTVKPDVSLNCVSGSLTSVTEVPLTTWQASVLALVVTAPSPTPCTMVYANEELPEPALAISSAIMSGDSAGAAIVNVTLSPAVATVSGAVVTAAEAAGAMTASEARAATNAAGVLHDMR